MADAYNRQTKTGLQIEMEKCEFLSVSKEEFLHLSDILILVIFNISRQLLDTR